jgi:hypothetical protein
MFFINNTLLPICFRDEEKKKKSPTKKKIKKIEKIPCRYLKLPMELTSIVLYEKSKKKEINSQNKFLQVWTRGKRHWNHSGKCREKGGAAPLFTFCGSFSMYVHDSRLSSCRDDW